MRVCNSDSGSNIYRKIDQNKKYHIKSTAIKRFRHVTRETVATWLAERVRVIYTLTDTKNDVRCPTFKTLSRDREWQGDVQPGSHRGTRKRKFDDSSYHSSQRFWYGTRRKGNPLTSFACVSKRLKKVPCGCLWQGDFTPRQATFHTRCSLWAGAKGNLLLTKKLTKTKVQLPRTSKQNFLQALHWSSKTKLYSSHYNSKMAHA